MPETPNRPTQFTPVELSLRLECLKIASTIQPEMAPPDLCEFARIFYYWLTTDNDVEQFFPAVEDSGGLLWEGATSR